MLSLAKKINLSDKLILRLSQIDKEKAEHLAVICKSKGFRILNTQSYLMRLAVILILAVNIKTEYDKRGIEDEIYYDTMSDIRIWCEKNKNRGLKNFNWLKNHVSFELFKIGRLQFQFYECKNKTLLYNKLPFSYGDNLIYIHIPEGERLEKEKCIASIKWAGEFFREKFPEYIYDFYFCESWLLFENNRSFMAKSSNIVSFMSLFDINYSVKVDAQAIERIYGKRSIIKERYPENTELQKRAKAYMMSGSRLGIGIGTIKK